MRKQNPIPIPLSKAKLLGKIEKAIKKGGVILTSHVRAEMERRNFGTPDILHVLKRRKGLNVKREWRPKYEMWHYRISGKDPGGSILTVVITVPEAEEKESPEELEDRIMVITAFYQK